MTFTTSPLSPEPCTRPSDDLGQIPRKFSLDATIAAARETLLTTPADPRRHWRRVRFDEAAGHGPLGVLAGQALAIAARLEDAELTDDAIWLLLCRAGERVLPVDHLPAGSVARLRSDLLHDVALLEGALAAGSPTAAGIADRVAATGLQLGAITGDTADGVAASR